MTPFEGNGDAFDLVPRLDRLIAPAQQNFRRASSSVSSFFRRWRSILGTTPATSQLDKLISRPTNATQEQLFEVVVRYPYHPLVGRRIAVLRRVDYAGLVRFVIEGPDGGRVLLPAWMTEPRQRCCPWGGPAAFARCGPYALRPVRPQRIPWSPSSGTNWTEVGDDGKSSTAESIIETTRSSGSRQRRGRGSEAHPGSQRGHRTAQASARRVHRQHGGDEGGER